MNVCSQCGIYNDYNALFCKNCRSQLINNSEAINRNNSLQSPISPYQSTAELQKAPDIIDIPSQNVVSQPQTINQVDQLKYLIDKRFSGNKADTKKSSLEQSIIHQPMGQSMKESRKWLIGVLVSIIIVTFIVILAFLIIKKNNSITFEDGQVYTQAEKYFMARDFTNASSKYWEILEKSSNDVMIGLAAERIEEMRNIEIAELMKKAEVSYNRKRYLIPENDNANLYIRQILELNPNHKGALKLQHQIISLYDELAKNAFQKKRYKDAISNFEKLLIIHPGDEYAKDQIAEMRVRLEKNSFKYKPKKRISNSKKNSIAKSKRNTPPVSKSSKLASNLAGAFDANGLKPSSKPDRTLQKKNSRISKPSNTYSDGVTSSENKKASNNAISNSASLSDSTKYLSTPENNSVIPRAKEKVTDSVIRQDRTNEVISIVEENQIDNGKKIYLKRVNPELPRGWNHTGFSLVRATCIIGINGTVESVTINSIFAPDIPTLQHQKLKEATIQTLKKYIYQPATYNGNPVKFKALETLSFK